MNQVIDLVFIDNRDVKTFQVRTKVIIGYGNLCAEQNNCWEAEKQVIMKTRKGLRRFFFPCWVHAPGWQRA